MRSHYIIQIAWCGLIFLSSCAKVTIPQGQQFYAYDGTSPRSLLRIYTADSSFKAHATEKDEVLYLTKIISPTYITAGAPITGLSLSGASFGTVTAQSRTVHPNNYYFSSIENANDNIDNPSLQYRKWDFYLQGMAIPLKFRPSFDDVRPSVESGTSLALAPGAKYSLNWFRGEKGALKSNTTTFAIAGGGLLGVGVVDVNSKTTQGKVTDSEATKNAIVPIGVHLVLGVNNINIGIGGGWDIITGPNRTKWNYHGRPWIGFIVGLDILKSE